MSGDNKNPLGSYKELQKQLEEAYSNATNLPAPELNPELNPDNWSDEYKAFREKYPDDHHKRVFVPSWRQNKTDNPE